jgi:penicillin amidase
VTADTEDAAAEDGVSPAPVPPVKRRRRWLRAALWSLVVLLVLVVLAGAGGVWAVRTAFPQYGGTLTIKGLSAPVTVYRDNHAIPQLYASNADDLFKAQGYVHAQERFWEMDFRRHVTSGRLAELFGAGQVETDKFLRTSGWRRVAEQEWSLISPESRRFLQDYADGVNAYLAKHGESASSLEYSVLKLQNSGYTIAKWDPVDSLAWLKAMAWDLRGNIDDEITRSILVDSGLSRAQVEQLYPAYPYAQHLPILAAATTGGSGGGGATPMTSAVPGVGSNSWVISGDRTSTGKPILANDPHLSPSMPSIWYQMGLHCTCDFNVAGFTFSGVPGVVIGHNARIAWGFTNLSPDVTDLYLEKLDGDRYMVDGAWRPLRIRQEIIKVAGGKPVTLTIRATGNGPLLSDVSDDLKKVGGTAYAVALRWTALDPGRTVDALFALDRAADWKQFRAAAGQFEVPSQNLVYADVDGNIGYQAPGRIPIRGKGDGRWPAPGWDSAYDWKGFLPYDSLPSALNPARGYVATANQPVTGPSAQFLTSDWSYGYRSQRILDMLAAATADGKKVSVADVQGMQLDNYNGLAAQLVPEMLRLPLTGRTAKAAALLAGWDFQQPADGRAGSAQAKSSAAAAYFNVFWRQLLSKTFDELPADRKAGGSDRWWVVVVGLFGQPDSPWWDNRSTARVETRDDIVAAAMSAAAGELAGRLGNDPAGWRWGRLHTLELRNASFGNSGIAPIEWLFNKGPIPVSGGNNIVNATGWDPAAGYEVDAVPSMRMIVDMSNLDSSRWVQVSGESGHAFSAHYSDQLDLWRTGQTLPMPWSEPSIRRSATDILTLRG